VESCNNNRNSMNCARNSMHSGDRQCDSCNRAMQNRERMAQQHRREECMEQRRREECVEQRRREQHMEQHRREKRVANQCEMNKQNRDRSVEVECVCKVSADKNCHRHDEMEHLGCEFPVVMSYVPWQQWGDMYEAECGLMQGTIFKDLNFIFCGERC